MASPTAPSPCHDSSYTHITRDYDDIHIDRCTSPGHDESLFHHYTYNDYSESTPRYVPPIDLNALDGLIRHREEDPWFAGSIRPPASALVPVGKLRKEESLDRWMKQPPAPRKTGTSTDDSAYGTQHLASNFGDYLATPRLTDPVPRLQDFDLGGKAELPACAVCGMIPKNRSDQRQVLPLELRCHTTYPLQKA